MNSLVAAGRFAALAVIGATTACASATDGSTVHANVRGTWHYTGTQVAPVADLSGSLTIASQDGETIAGSVSWEERSGPGMIQLLGGALSGRIIDTADVDFDVLLSTGARRHVARLTVDTMRGTWVQVESGRTGQFTAIRGAH